VGAASRNRTGDLRITRRTRRVHRCPVSHRRPARAAFRSNNVQADPGSLLADTLAPHAPLAGCTGRVATGRPQGPHARHVRGRVTCSPIDQPGAIYGPARVTRCLQNPPKVSGTIPGVARMVPPVRWSAPISGIVGVSGGCHLT
jgi:hypothetical protein